MAEAHLHAAAHLAISRCAFNTKVFKKWSEWLKQLVSPVCS